VSKYHAHRALVLAALADGVSIIRGVSRTRQVEWTISVLRALGAGITVAGDTYVVTGTDGRFRGVPVHERGSDGSEGTLDVGSSGTTLYFMTGLASLADQPMTVTGMKYFRRRPIKALLDALGQMGVQLESTADCPPITVQPVRPAGGDVEIAGTLSQWISGLLLLAPFAEHETRVHVTGGRLNERSYVDLTVRMMRMWGLEISVGEDGLTFTVPGGQVPRATDYTIPADVGSAAFGVAAAALHPADVLLEGLDATRSSDLDHPEADFLDIARGMGVPLEKDEATGWTRIRHDGLTLQPFDLDANSFPDLVPVLSVLATFADGTSHLRDVGHARLKESDRVAAMLQLNRLGGDVQQERTVMHIHGDPHGQYHGASLSSFNDHRVLMSLAVAGTRCEGETSLTYPHAYRVSYPEFLEAMTGIGLDIRVDAAPKDGGEHLAAEGDAGDGTNSDVGRSAWPADTQDTGTAGGKDTKGQDMTQDWIPDPADDEAVLPALVTEYARRHPEDPSVIEVTDGTEVSTTSWAELKDEADRVSQLLIELGIDAGDAVAVQLPNWREFVAVALGTMQVGGIVTPIMPVFGPREVSMTLTRSKARVLFLPSVFRGRQAAVELVAVAEDAAETGRRLALEHVVVVRTESRGSGREEPVAAPPIPDEAATRPELSAWSWRYYGPALDSVSPDPDQIASRMPGIDDPCQLLFTSGTTGEPKGVLHRYRTLGLATALHVRRSGLGPDDRVFVPTPLAHQTGFLYGMLLAWRLGVAQVIQPVWNGDQALTQGFEQGRASFVQAATPFLMDLVDQVESGRHAVPESLRIFVPTGAAVPRELAHKATTVLDTVVLGAFGTTETCLGALAGPSDPPESMWGTDGRPMDGIRLRITDDEGHEVPAGTEGNYEFSSPTMFDGYLARPDLTADVFAEDGWYRTGDLAFVDENGYLHITGRVKDVINRGGEKVPVAEVENLLYQHPLVADIAVVAMPDPRLGERACAFLVDAPGEKALELDTMREYLQEAGLSKYYWPERVEHVTEMPRNPAGKIQKNTLREQAAALVAEQSTGTKES
jgi:cyclohexanecarboxylate-CoA ligase